MRQLLNLRNTQKRGSTFQNADLSESMFCGVNLSGSTFDDVNLGKCMINNVSLGSTKTTHSCFTQPEIDGSLTDRVINGIPVKDMISAQGESSREEVPVRSLEYR